MTFFNTPPAIVLHEHGNYDDILLVGYNPGTETFDLDATECNPYGAGRATIQLDHRQAQKLAMYLNSMVKEAETDE